MGMVVSLDKKQGKCSLEVVRTHSLPPSIYIYMYMYVYLHTGLSMRFVETCRHFCACCPHVYVVLLLCFICRVETGEWPTAAVSRRIAAYGLSAGGNPESTPVGTPDPSRVGTPNHSEYSCAMDDDEVGGSTSTKRIGRVVIETGSRNSRIFLYLNCLNWCSSNSSSSRL